MKENLASTGITIPKHDWQGNPDALAAKITTIGTKADRLNVYENSSQTSQIIAKVPGSTEFIVIQKETDWLLIKLLGEKKGYINKKDIK